MIVECASSSKALIHKGVWTYNDLMELPYGRRGRLFVLLSMFVAAYGAMVAYLLIIKDTLPVVLGFVNDGDASVGGFVERELVMMVTSICICVPLSMQRDFSSLAFTSSISVSADILLVVFVAVFAPIGESVETAGGITAVLTSSIIHSGFFIGFGVLTTAMCCQHSAFIVASSLQNPTPQRWSSVTSISLTISVVCCLVLGVAGYLGFLEETSGDVLNNFGVGLQPNVARGLLAITMFFTYPMEAFVARHVLVELIWNGDMDGYMDIIVDEEESSNTVDDCETPTPTTGEGVKDGIIAAATTKQQKRIRSKCLGVLNRRQQVTLLIYVVTLIPALLVEDLGPVLSITGAIGGCALAYIGPGLAYLGIHGDDFLQRLANVILSMNTKTKTTTTVPTITSTTTEAELPMEGDATAQIIVDPRTVFSEDSMKGSSTPWWWYPLLMPLWVSIALSGSQGLNERLTALEGNHRPQNSPTNENNDDTADNTTTTNETTTTTTTSGVGVDASSQQQPTTSTGTATATATAVAVIVEPCVMDYGFAIFFIIFGSIAMLAGVASNVYVQIHEIFNLST
mmetsp:Transcript_38157/g.43001  ORF Transcript_38157/g.43001 Transcript_38157/m.43001 type:complete len:570 (-) Transcript_38157:171-1880(-)